MEDPIPSQTYVKVEIVSQRKKQANYELQLKPVDGQDDIIETLGEMFAFDEEGLLPYTSNKKLDKRHEYVAYVSTGGIGDFHDNDEVSTLSSVVEELYQKI